MRWVSVDFMLFVLLLFVLGTHGNSNAASGGIQILDYF